MVDALRSVWRVVRPGGLVASIQPLPDLPTIFCEIDDARRPVGTLRGPRQKFREAERRLARVVRDGAFRPRGSAAFHYLHYAASLAALQRSIPTEWKSMWIPESVTRRVRVLLGPAARGTLIVDEPARITVLTRR